MDQNYCYVYFPSKIKLAGLNGYNKDRVKKKKPSKEQVDIIAKEVIRGNWGVGEERKNRLETAGYDYAVIQHRVNELLS